MKPIRLTKHALGYTASRGFTVAEWSAAKAHFEQKLLDENAKPD